MLFIIGCQGQQDAANIRLKALAAQTPASSQGCLQRPQTASHGTAPQESVQTTPLSIVSLMFNILMRFPNNTGTFKETRECFVIMFRMRAPWVVRFPHLSFWGLQLVPGHNVDQEVELVELCYRHGDVVPL